MDAPKSVTFIAAFPDIQSAFSMDGRGDGARIKLDIPRSDVDAVVLLHQFCTGKPLRVTVEVLEDERETTGNNRKLQF